MISLEGIPSFDSQSLFVNNRCFTSAELAQVNLEHYVRITRSCATSIDRVAKLITLDNGSRVAYDYLILAPGLQYNVANHSEDIAKLSGVVDMNRSQINKIQEEIETFKKSDEKMRLVVYGRSLQVFATVNHLVNQGVPGKKIIVVIPSYTAEITPFNNPDIEKKVFAELRNLDIDVYQDTYLSNWTASPDNAITHVTLAITQPQHTYLTIKCTAFFYADEKTVHPDSFRAINDACLVFDGRLVIDKYYRTVDPVMYVLEKSSIRRLTNQVKPALGEAPLPNSNRHTKRHGHTTISIFVKLERVSQTLCCPYLTPLPSQRRLWRIPV